MADKTPVAVQPVAVEGTPAAVTPPVRRHPGHRGADVRDTVAEMAAKAQEISMEAGSKMAAAMKEVISAAAGLTSFTIESSRDLVQYMVRRGQMTQDEADKLIREAEEAWSRKHRGKKPPLRAKAGSGSRSSARKPPRKKPSGKKRPAKKKLKAKKKKPARRKPAAKKRAKSKK